MCGLYGMVALRAGADCDPSLLDAMAAVTVHRGPDDEGRHAERRLAMGTRRLSLIDLRTGHQPHAKDDGPTRTACQRVIYNLRPLHANSEAARVHTQEQKHV